MYTPVTSADGFSFTVERIGRFILVGEQLPEETVQQIEDPANTSEDIGSSQEGTSDINVSVPPVKGTSAVIMALIIIAVILLVIIALLVYTYAFKQEY